MQSRVGNWVAWAVEVVGMFGENDCIVSESLAWGTEGIKCADRPSSAEQQTDQRLERTSPA